MNAAQRSLEQSLAEAIVDYNAGRLDRSETSCRALLREHSGHPALLQLLAVLLLKRGNFSAARTSIEGSLSARPDHLASLLVAGQIERAAGELRSATRRFSRALALAPRAAEPAYLLGTALAELGDPSAIAVLRGLVVANPGYADGWCQLGLALKSAGILEESLAAFERALAIDLNLARAEAARGAVLHALGRVDQAVLALRRAQMLQPDSAPVAHDLGMALHQAQQLDAASAALERAVTLDARFAQAWFRLGLVRQDQGQLDSAATAFRTALAHRADYAEAAVNLGIVLQDQGNLDGALRSYRHAVRLRADTLGRIAQALTAASKGLLWLDPRHLRRQLQSERVEVATEDRRLTR